MSSLKLSLFQTDIIWEDIAENLSRVYNKLQTLKEETDIVVLPEMFSTGFSMQSEAMAETIDEKTIGTLKEWASQFEVAITGSFIAKENGKYYNRGFFILPNQEVWYYDKRHLFRMGDETKHFSGGNKKLIVNYKGWNICLLICYDLRFPVWSRNTGNEYDLLLYVANWPASRRHVWDALLPARTLENMSYVCGVNRVGVDGNNLSYNGGSIVYSPKGETLAKAPDDMESVITVEINLESLRNLREKFPVWKDADEFSFVSL